MKFQKLILNTAPKKNLIYGACEQLIMLVELLINPNITFVSY